MLNHYYDLKDESRLPSNSKFLDPYDLTTFTVNSPSENLASFLKRIADHREKHQYPKVVESDLRELVVASLLESTPKEKISEYFVPMKALPTAAQTYSLAKAMARELIHTSKTSLKAADERGKKCLGCAFHQRSKTWSKPVADAIPKLVGLGGASVSEINKSLGSCGMCGCPLSNKVRFSMMPVLASVTPEQFDKLLRLYGSQAFERCWILKEALEDNVTRDVLQKKLNAGSANGGSLLSAYNQLKIMESKNGTKKEN